VKGILEAGLDREPTEASVITEATVSTYQYARPAESFFAEVASS
jgi:hypothetical protein